MQLLITPYLSGIAQTLLHLPAVGVSPFPVMEIQAPTGSGKTAGIPNYLLLNTSAIIFVALPTRVAVISGYQSQKEILTENSGVGGKSPLALIGYAQERNIAYTDKSRLVYATSGHVLNKVKSLFKDGNSSNWTFCDILFIDEVHAGSIENHMIMRLWLLAYRQQKQIPRLLLATATPGRLEREIFGKYITIALSLPRKYPIYDFFHPTQYLLHDSKLYTSAAEVAMAVHLHGTSLETEKGFQGLGGTKNKLSLGRTPGNILIFVPGAHESKEVLHRLNELIKEKGVRHLKIFELRSDSTQEEIKQLLVSKVMVAVDGEMPRIALIATNVAESSINIPDMMFCIDTMTEKRNFSNMSGSSKLVLHWISKASSMQRRGRVGRFKTGYYYRMCIESFYSSLEEIKPEEITRASLTTPVMSLLDSGLDPYLILQGAGVTKISNSVALLKTYGGIEVLNGQLRTTHLGKFAAKLGIGFRMARFLWDWWKQTSRPMFPAVMLAAIIDTFTRTLYYFPSSPATVVAGEGEVGKAEGKEVVKAKEKENKVREEVKAKLAKYIVPGLGDLGVYVSLMIEFTNEVRGNLEVSRPTSVAFTNAHFLDHRRFRETWDNMVQIHRSLSEYGKDMDLRVGDFDIYNMFRTAVPLLNTIYSDYKMKLSSKGGYVQGSTGFAYNLQNRDSIVSDKPKELIALSISELALREGKVIRLITLWVPTVVKAEEKKEEPKVVVSEVGAVEIAVGEALPDWANTEEAIEVNLDTLVDLADI